MKSTVSLSQISPLPLRNSVYTVFFVLLAFFTLLSCPLRAQVTISKVSIDAGIMNNPQLGMGSVPRFAFYPEAGLGGLLYVNYIEWGVSLGYWGDGVNTPSKIMDQVTYSFNSLILKSDLRFFPANAFEHFRIPVHLITGLSIHGLTREYIGGEDFSGSHLPSQSYNILAFDLGLGLNMKISSIMRLRAESEFYIPLSRSHTFFDHSSSSSMKLGIDYFLN